MKETFRKWLLHVLEMILNFGEKGYKKMTDTGPENVVVPGEAEPAEGTVGSSVPEETEEETEEETDDEESDTELDTIAREVLEGKWGEGQEQRLKLSEAGHDPKKVHAAVTKIRNNL